DDVRQSAGHADEPCRAGALELEHGLQRAVLLQGLPRRRDVELQDVEMIGPHAREALLDALKDVVAGEDVRASLPARSRRRADEATALAREIVLGAPIGNI